MTPDASWELMWVRTMSSRCSEQEPSAPVHNIRLVPITLLISDSHKCPALNTCKSDLVNFTLIYVHHIEDLWYPIQLLGTKVWQSWASGSRDLNFYCGSQHTDFGC